ncbi:hypothetical protein NM688_g3710 [Phlebia brevispora]|uniref:Uncharacterized protein n=1 Tax=Phlebia brevispora TaxID=194682 RepID=A0ACC1T4X2_9APHY|nr:hypothetical protein NM688_g3710 [Phlebia brevispora]
MYTYMHIDLIDRLGLLADCSIPTSHSWRAQRCDVNSLPTFLHFVVTKLVDTLTLALADWRGHTGGVSPHSVTATTLSLRAGGVSTGKHADRMIVEHNRSQACRNGRRLSFSSKVPLVIGTMISHVLTLILLKDDAPSRCRFYWPLHCPHHNTSLCCSESLDAIDTRRLFIALPAYEARYLVHPSACVCCAQGLTAFFATQTTGNISRGRARAAIGGASGRAADSLNLFNEEDDPRTYSIDSSAGSLTQQTAVPAARIYNGSATSVANADCVRGCVVTLDAFALKAERRRIDSQRWEQGSGQRKACRCGVHILDGHAAVNGQVGGAGSTSPRKRRSGGGANSRRRRRENGADGTYPNPPKRTRNTRGTSAVATFASPLAGPAITPGDDDIPDGGEHVQLDSTVAASTPQEPQAATEAAGEFEVPEQRRSTRSRRSRPAGPTRRHSSASETTTTSVSVSIAANTRNTRSSGNRAYQESEEKADEQADVEMKQEDSAGERAEQVTESANPPKDAEKPPETVATPIEAPAPSDAQANRRQPRLSRQSHVPEPSDEKKAGAPELKKISSIEKKSAESPADRISKPPEEPKESKEAPEATVVAAGQPKAKEPPIPDVPRLGQKILPSSSWTRFAAPVAGPAGPNANQKKIRDEEKEEGELSEESDTPPSRER